MIYFTKFKLIDVLRTPKSEASEAEPMRMNH